MFRRLETANTDTVVIRVDGESLEVPADIPLAAALLLHGKPAGRHNPVIREQRSGICMMGVCFECLLEVNGVNQRSCQVDCEDGMTVSTQMNLESENNED